MGKRKFRKLLISAIVGGASVGVFTTTFTTFSTQPNHRAAKQQSVERTPDVKATENRIEYKFGDIVKSYNNGYVAPTTFSRIVVAKANAANDAVPDTSNILFEIANSGDTVEISNTFGTKPDLWKTLGYETNMFDPISFDEPWTHINQNFFRAALYDSSSSGIEGSNTTDWNSASPSPSGIAKRYTLNNKNTLTLQFSIQNTTSTNFNIYKQTGTDSWEKLTTSAGSGFVSSGNLIKGETIIQKDISDPTGAVKIYTPQNEYSNIPSDTTPPATPAWKVNKGGNAIANKYFNITISEAFELLKEPANHNDIKSLVDFLPVLCTNSMSDYPIVLEFNTASERLEFKYGETLTDSSNPNKYFKNVFYYTSQGGVTKHLYPWQFDTAGLPEDRLHYHNAKQYFEKYNTGVSVIEGKYFANGTYIKNGELALDKNRYPSQVPIDEIKQAVFDKIANRPEGFALDNVIIKEGGESNLIVDNSKGTISFNVLVTKYKDSSGATLQNSSGYKIGSIEIQFNKKTPPTSNISTFDTRDGSNTASSLDENAIKNVIYTNRNAIFANLAQKVDPTATITTDDISFTSKPVAHNVPSGEYKTGWIECNVKLSKGYLSSPRALPVTKPDATGYRFKLILTGFKKQETTIFHTLVDVSGIETYSKEYASKYAAPEAFMSLYNSKTNLFVEGLPDGAPPPTITGPIRYDNLGNDKIGDGSGYITVDLTFPKTQSETGAEISQKKTFTVFGFKKVIPTVIYDKVTLLKENELATNVIQGSQQEKNDKLKEIIIASPSSFFGITSLPNNYSDSLAVTVNEVKNVVNPDNPATKWQVDATLSMSSYFNSSGVLVTGATSDRDKYIVNVKIDGFKPIIPTTVLNDVVVSVDPDFGDRNYAFQILDKDNNYLALKETILDKTKTRLQKQIINGSIPDDFTEDSIVIATAPIPGFPGSRAPEANNTSGEIQFSMYIKSWYSQVDGKPITSTDFTPDSPHGTITLRGFLKAEPTEEKMNSTLVIPSNDPNYALLKNTNVSLMVQYLNNLSVLTPEEKAVVNQFKLFLYNNVFDGYKPPNIKDNPDIIVIEPFDGGSYSYESLNGSLSSIKVKMKGYMDNTGTIRDDYFVTVQPKNVLGFKKIVPTVVNPKSQVSNKPFQVSAEFADLTPDFIKDNNKLADVIRLHDADPTIDPSEKIILGDIPPMFIWQVDKYNDYKTGSLLIQNVTTDDNTSSISFTLSLNCYYSATNGDLVITNIVYPEPVLVIITGFKTIPSTTINGVVIEDKYIYPTKSNTFRKPMEIDIQPQSDAKFKTAQGFVDSLYPNSNNTAVITESIIKNSIFDADSYTINLKKNQPIVLFNPEPQNKMIIKALLIDDVNNDLGTIKFTAIVEGSYFSKSTKPTKIQNSDTKSSACIDINLKGFVPFAVYKASGDRPVILIPVLLVSIVFVVFLISLFTRLGISRAKKPARDKDLIFED